MPLTTAMQAVATNFDVTDLRSVCAISLLNICAHSFGDAVFQLLVGLGSAAIIWFTIWEKWQKIRRERAQFKKDFPEEPLL